MSQSCPMPMRNTGWDEIQHALSMSSWEIYCSHTACAASFEWGPFKFHWRVIGPASKTCRFLGTMDAAAAASKLHLFTRTSSICPLLAASMRLIKLTKPSGAAAAWETNPRLRLGQVARRSKQLSRIAQPRIHLFELPFRTPHEPVERLD